MTLPTRDQILQAAAKVFAEHGFRGSTTRLIADAADVNEVTLFRLFGSKDALLGEAIRTRVYEREVVPLPETPGDARGELIAWTTTEYENLLAHRASIRQGMSELVDRPELARCMAQGQHGGYMRLQRYFAALIKSARCRTDVSAVDAAALLLGALFADAMARDMMPDTLPAARQVPAAYVDLTLRAIGYAPRTAAASGTRRARQARGGRSA